MGGLCIVVVGNKFDSFSNQSNILTYDQFEEYLSKYDKKK